MTLRTWLIVGATLIIACTFPSADARYAPTELPDEATFAPVAELLSVRCGSLDCHGSVYRSTGLRYLPADRPLSPLCNTCEENQETYQSVVGLEPEKMSLVASGANPDILTMVEKARGAEAHKGGQIWSTGDDSDNCLTSWLTGTPNSVDCENGVGGVLMQANPAGDALLTCFGAPCSSP
jgi:hypothetical protein